MAAGVPHITNLAGTPTRASGLFPSGANSMKFFASKKPTKKHTTADDEVDDDDYFQSQPPSPTKSPDKPTRASRSPTKKTARPESPSAASARESKPRTPRSLARQATDPGSSSSSRRKKIDTDTHPLNLPPEQRKRLSALSAMSSRNSMDIDKEPPNGGSPSPPPPQPQSPAAQPVSQPPPQTSNSFTVPITNGANGQGNSSDSDVPVPPPHKSQPSSPTQTAADDAETFKNEGNKFFKAKDYIRAIEFYTKGGSLPALTGSPPPFFLAKPVGKLIWR